MSLEPHHADHACVLVEDFDEQKRVVLPFIRTGLRNGERCIYVANGQSIEDWYLEFQTYGIDVESALASGQLEVTHSWAQPQAGQLNSIQVARRVWGALRDGLERFSAVRFAVDMSLTVDAGTPDDQLCHWEATLDSLLEGLPCRALCLYDLHRLGPGTICAALRTHPIAAYRGRTHENPIYEAPRILAREPELNHMDADEALIEQMLARLATSHEVSPEC